MYEVHPMSEKFQCPSHVGTFLTPTDSECHDHASNTQQYLHNLHCRLLGCPRAQQGAKRQSDGVPLIEPRNLFERLLKFCDKS